MNHMLDVTIAYPEGNRRFWDFVCGRTGRIEVCVRALPLGADVKGDYFGDDAYRARFQQWLNDRWQAKDECLANLSQGRRCGDCPGVRGGSGVQTEGI